MPTDDWNSSLTGDYLWARGYLADLMPGVMTPSTWSLMELWLGNRHGLAQSAPFSVPFGYDMPVWGNIGGRLYTNLTPIISPHMRMGRKAARPLRALEGLWGNVPPDMDVSVIEYPRGAVIRDIIPSFRIRGRQLARERVEIPEFAEEIADWCAIMRRRITRVEDGESLAALWREDIQPKFERACYLATVATTPDLYQLQTTLVELLGEEATLNLLAALGGDLGLESMGPLLGLAHVLDDTWTPREYLTNYGHRGPHEFELSAPRPAEDPDWLEARLAEFNARPVDVAQIRADQRGKSAEIWDGFQQVYRRKWGLSKRSFQVVSAVEQLRAVIQSEQVRIIGVIRALIQRAGELTRIEDGGFFLTLDELCDVLEGETVLHDQPVAELIAARQAEHARYCDLPRLPAVINGPFDPLAWAENPNRRPHLFDGHAELTPPPPEVIAGYPGAAGVVEGVVRCVDSVEEGRALEPGEILVTAATNTGWVLLYPRAAAIITDEGAPLSHAALVGRDLGIPAVVGCATATARLKTGDRVRVDGVAATVTVLESA